MEKVIKCTELPEGFIYVTPNQIVVGVGESTKTINTIQNNTIVLEGEQ